MKAAREKQIESQWQDMEDGMAQGDSKQACQLLKTLTKTSVIEDSNGHFSQKAMPYSAYELNISKTCSTSSRMQTATFFKTTRLQPVQHADQPDLLEEIERAVPSLKGGKSRDVDYVPAELL